MPVIPFPADYKLNRNVSEQSPPNGKKIAPVKYEQYLLLLNYFVISTIYSGVAGSSLKKSFFFPIDNAHLSSHDMP
jgi:hypothetical protein